MELLVAIPILTVLWLGAGLSVLGGVYLIKSLIRDIRKI